jgi:hypothetical protein
MGAQETLFWWPYNDNFPAHPGGLAFEMVIATEFPVLRALWSIKHMGSTNYPSFNVEYNPVEGYIMIDNTRYGWELEND